MFAHSNVGQSSRISESFEYPDILIYGHLNVWTIRYEDI